jgi:hypothetical protein
LVSEAQTPDAAQQFDTGALANIKFPGPNTEDIMADTVKYDTFYSLFMTGGVDRYVSISPESDAYLHSAVRTLWFSKVGGCSSGTARTGDVVNIKMNTAVGKEGRLTRGQSSEPAITWSEPKNETAAQWQLWNDVGQTPGQEIPIGRPVFISPVDGAVGRDPVEGWIIHRVSHPSYLTIGPASQTPMVFEVRTEYGSSSHFVPDQAPPR